MIRIEDNVKKIYKIYVLRYNNEVIYVGQTTTSLSRRKSGGYHYIPKEITKKSNIELIEETTDVTHERWWINYFKEKGCNLYNREAGEGFNIKEYICNYSKEWRKNNPIAHKNYVKKYKEKNNEKMKEYNRNYMREYRKNKKNKND